jgi:glycerol-3-phosphate dehydrogenase
VGVRSGGRFLFAVPWNGVTMLGTGYEAAPYLDELADALPGAPGFLADCARAFPWLDLCDSDVRLVHEGLVPANGDASRVATRTWLRDHARDGARGVITVQAVKLTTARGVAERAVDVALRALGRAPVRCRTAETPLDLARPLLGGLRASLSATPEVNSGAAPPRGAPAPRTPGPDVPGLPTRCIDQAVRFAVREEQALHLGDVVLRRTDLGTAGPPSPDSVARVARVMAAELGWSDETLAEERRRYAAEEASLALSARRRAR